MARPHCRGFAIDLARFDGTGIDKVHILLHGNQDIGSATYGLDRPDIGLLYGRALLHLAGN